MSETIIPVADVHASAPSVIRRRGSRQIKVGWVEVGGGAPVRVQSMTTTKTADVNATLQQMASLVATGVDIVRVAVPHWEDAEALKQIASHATVPVVADIHFQWKYAMAALEAGIHGLRINPGNIKYQDKVRLIAREAKARGVPIRIGVNAGSLEKDLLAKYGRPTPEALVESALSEVRILEDEDFTDIKISVKHSNPIEMIEAYRMLAEKVACPSCGRAEVDVLGLTRKVNEALEARGLKAPIRVAVMGCVVNGPGEAREADLGIAAGNGYGQLIVRGEVKQHRIPEDEIVEVLVAEAEKMAHQKELEAA